MVKREKQEVIKGKREVKENNVQKLKDFSKQEWELLINNIDFTDEELKIITLSRRGFRQIDIAEELYISVSTVKRRLSKISYKVFRFIAFYKP